MELAAITLTFDPVVPLGDTASISLETIGVGIAIFVAIVLAAWIGRRTPATGRALSAAGPGLRPTGRSLAATGRSLAALGLRPDDLLFIAVGAVPGAVLGGRLGYVLDHLEFYRANPSLIADFSQGGLSLTLGVPLGIATAALLARLIGAPVWRWLHAAALPLLVGLALGKVASVLGGSGQGLASDLPWATAYSGPGPWGSLAPDVPSQPAQVYEALLLALAIGGLLAASGLRVVAKRDGGAMFVALGLWAAARFVVAFTWRDPVAVGPFRVDQVLSLLLLALAVLGVLERRRAPSLAPGWGESEPDIDASEPDIEAPEPA